MIQQPTGDGQQPAAEATTQTRNRSDEYPALPKVGGSRNPVPTVAARGPEPVSVPDNALTVIPHDVGAVGADLVAAGAAGHTVARVVGGKDRVVPGAAVQRVPAAPARNHVRSAS